MDYPPPGHHSHHHHRRDDDDDNRFPPPPTVYPPPPSYDNPPPFVHHTSHYGGVPDPSPYPPPSFAPPDHHHHYQPPPPSFNYSDDPYSSYQPPPPVHHVSHDNYSSYQPPPPPVVEHVSHEHHYAPHMPSFISHHTHHSGSGPVEPERSRKPPVRVFTKAKPDFSLTIRDDRLILAHSDPSDPFQQWIKDEKYSTKVKDEEGFPSFALVNKVTGQAIKHSIGATHPVRLIPYNPDVLDESVLWTLSKDLGDGYRAMRMVNNIRLNFDAFHGDKDHGGVRDGTTIVLWEWKKGDNQRWNIIPHS